MRRNLGCNNGFLNDRTKEVPNRWRRPWIGLWSLVVRNRIAIAIASLIWLAWRSGTQPRRLAYPCQQAAAANLGFLAVLFIPGLAKMKARQAATVRQRAMALATGSVCLAGLLFVLISGGIAVYSEYTDGAMEAAPVVQSIIKGTGVPATVGIVRNTGWSNDAVLDQMVRDAVALAGGLEPLMVDTRGGGSAPFESPDGGLNVIICPNPSYNDNVDVGLYTHPRVLATVVDLAWEAGADVVKIGGTATGDNFTVFTTLGYDSNGDHWLDHDPSVPILDLNDTGSTATDFNNGTYQTNNVHYITLPSSGDGAANARSGYYVHDELLKADAMIVVPCIKNHDLGTITLGLKMRIGTGPQDIYYHPTASLGGEPWLRWEFHNHVNSGLYYLTKFPWDVGSAPTSEPEAVQRSFVDLNLVRPHDFVVLDATRGIENGPVPATPVYTTPVNSILASRDTVALDTIGALVMGYDPDQIPCITMADNSNVLGTKDRDLITVLGDHVQTVRVDFSTSHSSGYAQAYRADSVSPSITGINITEGQVLSGIVSIVGSGITDNSGTVIKSELTVDGTLVGTDTTNNSASFSWDSGTVSDGSHQLTITVYDDEMNEGTITRNVTVNSNLLVNGDFEAGSTGWTTYRAGWAGTNGSFDFNSTEPGHIGSACLRLYLNSGQESSFAAYQEVTVTPGNTYEIDAYWKANKYGNDNWYEIMLLDGPWDVDQADTGGALVLNNHMYAYDTNPSANCPSGNPIPASFDWIWTHDQNNDPVDDCWNDRNGRRTASGSTMTVVLKAGACCGTSQADVWFDEVSLVDVTSALEVCSDGLDNDGDGLTDCCDTGDCGSDPSCLSENSCTDGVDNDCDGQIDCCDSNCSGDAACGGTEFACTDGVDNDCNGLVDCADTAQCGSDPACQTPDTTPPTVSNARPVDATDPADCISPPATAQVKASVSDDRAITASGIFIVPNDPAAGNLLTNPSFENGGGSLSGWTASSWGIDGAYPAPSGAYDGLHWADTSCSWNNTMVMREIRQEVSGLTPNQGYLLSVYIWTAGSPNPVTSTLLYEDGPDPGLGNCNNMVNQTSASTVWAPLEGPIVPTGSTVTVCLRVEASCASTGFGVNVDLFTLAPMTSADSYDGATATWNSVQLNSDQDHLKVVAVDDAGNASAMVDSYSLDWYLNGAEPECTGPDLTPPVPNPMTWASVPSATGSTSIAMTATTASDPSGVEYYFTCTAGGGHDSGWQASPTYEDTGLQPNTMYTYTVKARDLSVNQNETGASGAQSATTDPPPDLTPPSPDPMTWASVPAATGTTSIAMTATTASDPSGVEYYFSCISGNCNDSGWQSSPTYEDTGLHQDTSYTYTVRARDLSSNLNETAASTAESAATDREPGWSVLTYDDFEGGWGNYTAGGGDCLLDTSGAYAHQGSNAADIQDNSGVSSSFYHTNSYDVTPYNQLRVTFWYRPVGMESGEDFFLEYNDGGGWVIVEDWISGTDFSNDQFYNPSVFLDNGTYSFTTTAQFRFRCDASANQDDVYIDEIEVAGSDGDAEPPTPDPMTWASVPAATGTTSIAMTATTASDPNGVEYYFACTAGGGNDSGWQASPTYEDTGLQPDTTYTYMVKARDLSLTQNETAASGEASATTNPPPPVQLISAVSRKTHGAAGDWDIDVGIGQIECRSAQVGTANPNELLIVATFDKDIGLLGGADVTSDAGTVTNVLQTDMRVIHFTVTGLSFNTQLNLTFPGVLEGSTLDPLTACNSTLCMRVIVGDYDDSGRTNFIDFSKIKAAGYINQLVVSVDMARADFDCGSRPNFLDFSKVKAAGLINQTATACTTPIGP